MTVPEILYYRALQAGFTVEAACSLLAMVQGESAFRSDNAEDRINRVVSDAEYIRRADAGLMTYGGKNFIYDEVGFGYIQWTHWSRKKGLLEYAKSLGTSVADHNTQKEFIFIEMQRDFPQIWSICRESHDLEFITKKLIWIWENPANKQAVMNERFPYAKAWFAKFSNWTPTENETNSASSETPKENVDDEGLPLEKTWPPRTIQNGLNWPETYLLQSLLRCHGYNVLSNGIFSDSLTAKVKEYQLKEGLVSDGIVGPKTWRRLMTLPTDY